MKIAMVFLILSFFSNSAFGQLNVYEGPEDPAGDIDAEREGWMDGNRIFLYFRNTTELSDWSRDEDRRSQVSQADHLDVVNEGGDAEIVIADGHLSRIRIPPETIGIRPDQDAEAGRLSGRQLVGRNLEGTACRSAVDPIRRRTDE